MSFNPRQSVVAVLITIFTYLFPVPLYLFLKTDFGVNKLISPSFVAPSLVFQDFSHVVNVTLSFFPFVRLFFFFPRHVDVSCKSVDARFLFQGFVLTSLSRQT